MKLRFFSCGWWALVAVAVSLLSACAQIVAPSGGPKDTQPPQLDSALSSPNRQTHFHKQDIVLVFDEFIKLYDPYTQIVVSPPLSKRPIVEVEKYRRIRFRFDEEEVLHPNTTYTIYFGKAIQDFTEGNVLDFRFVFSTGARLDSLVAQGRVTDARTGEGVPNVLVMLYEAAGWRDSVVVEALPLYFTRTDAQGHYRLENLRRDTFMLFALEDANNNYRFDQSSERIAFRSEPVVSGRDTSGREQWPDLRMFTQEQPLKLLSVQSDQYGFLRLLFNRPPADVEIRAVPEPDFIYRKVEKDSLLIWYHRADTATWRLLLAAPDFRDTISVDAGDRAAFLAAHVLGFRQTGPGAQQVSAPPPERGGKGKPSGKTTTVPALIAKRKQLPQTPAALDFSTPLHSINDSLLLWWEDSLLLEQAPLASIDTLDARRLTLNYAWKPGHTYRLALLPGALRDIYGVTNDSLQAAWGVLPEEEISSLQLRVVLPDSTQSYVLRLLKGEQEVRTFALSRQKVLEKHFPALEPGNYRLQVITDYNGNGRWDTGDFWRKRQPEQLWETELETLRPNWEVQAEVKPD